MRRFEIGDRVTVREATTLFHHRTQAYTRGRTGVVVEHRPEWLIPEDEAWQREDGRVEPFYVVRFRQRDLWPGYTGLDMDTLETEMAEGWLAPAAGEGAVTHEHDHHAPIGAADEISEFDVLETALRELAIEKGLFSAEDHRRFMEWAQRIGPHGGSRLVARAWLDPEFKQRLLSDGTETSKEIGIDWLDPTGTGTPSDFTYFYVLENTPEVHNVIVCTLCSCYPRPVLGQAPEWYKTPHYRRRVVRWPREVLAEFGLHLPHDVEVRVHDSNQKSRFMVMPMRPEGTEGWTEDQLAAIVTRDTMIGVALPRADWTADRSPAVTPR